MATPQTTEQQKRLSCVTCNTPLPIGDDGRAEEPDSFACSSSGWTAENERNRDVENLSTLNIHMKTATDALWDLFTEIELSERKDLDLIEKGFLIERHVSY